MGYVPTHEPSEEEADKVPDVAGGDPRPPAREEGDALQLHQSPVVAVAHELASSFSAGKFFRSPESHLGECSRRTSPRNGGFRAVTFADIDFCFFLHKSYPFNIE